MISCPFVCGKWKIYLYNGREQVLFVRFMNERQYRWALIFKQVSVCVYFIIRWLYNVQCTCKIRRNDFKVFGQLALLLSKINGFRFRERMNVLIKNIFIEERGLFLHRNAETTVKLVSVMNSLSLE